MAYTIGLDYGTNSVRCVIVDTSNGNEVGTSVFNYPTGDAGIILNPNDHNIARQNPADYIKGLEITVKDAWNLIMNERRENKGQIETRYSHFRDIGTNCFSKCPMMIQSQIDYQKCMD